MAMVPSIEAPPDQTQRRNRSLLGLLAPGVLWLLVFFVLPLLIVVVYSFATNGPTGKVIWSFNLDSYRLLLTKDLYYNAYIRSFVMGVETTLICALIGYPLALHMVLAPPARRTVLLFLILIPF